MGAKKDLIILNENNDGKTLQTLEFQLGPEGDSDFSMVRAIYQKSPVRRVFESPLVHHKGSIRTHTSIEATLLSQYGLTRPRRETTTILSGRFFVVPLDSHLIGYWVLHPSLQRNIMIVLKVRNPRNRRINMELAKITSKGQVTIPVDIRKKYGLTEGSKVLFLEEGNRVYLMNSTMMALAELQQSFAGAAAEAGLTCEEDVIQMMKDYRERSQKK